MARDLGDGDLSPRSTEDVEWTLTEALLLERERSAFLAEASRSLSGLLNLDRALQRTVDLAVPTWADWAHVAIRTARGLEATATGGLRGVTPLGRRGDAVVGRRGLRRVLSTGRRELLDDLAPGDLDELVPHEGLRADASALGARSSLTLPLRARGEVFGVLTLLRTLRPTFDREEVSTCEDLAQRAAMAIDAARLYAERSHTARVLQDSLRPQALPDVPGATLAAYYRSASTATGDIGGDFYDVHGTDRDWSLIVGDVTGKGVRAAVLTGQARHALRTAGLVHRAPSRMLALANQVLLGDDDGRFATIVCCRLRPRDDGGARLDVATAGHPAPLVFRADGTTSNVPVAGIVAGVLPDQRYQEATVDLHPGDTCLLYTDGVTEARRRDGAQFGLGRIERLLPDCSGAEPQAMVDYLAQAVHAHLGGAPHDDIALLAVRVDG